MTKEGASHLPTHGVEGQGTAGRQAEQAEMMSAWRIFGWIVAFSRIFLPSCEQLRKAQPRHLHQLNLRHMQSK
jgi:hypothetical protein